MSTVTQILSSLRILYYNVIWPKDISPSFSFDLLNYYDREFVISKFTLTFQKPLFNNYITYPTQTGNIVARPLCQILKACFVNFI